MLRINRYDNSITYLSRGQAKGLSNFIVALFNVKIEGLNSNTLFKGYGLEGY